MLKVNSRSDYTQYIFGRSLYRTLIVLFGSESLDSYRFNSTLYQNIHIDSDRIDGETIPILHKQSEDNATVLTGITLKGFVTTNKSI